MLGNHLLGIYEKAFETDISLKSTLKKAAILGFDYVEISIDESDERLSRLEWSPVQTEELRREVYENGLTIQSMCLSAHRRFPFGSSNPVIREKAYEIMEKAIDMANQLGIRVIQLAGYDVYYEDSTDESVRLFKQGLKWSVKEAARKQVMLAMEIMDTPFMNSISKNLIYEKELGSLWYHTYPDLGNLSAWPENDPLIELEKGIDSIVAVHLKDTLKVTDSFPGKFKCVTFGEGCVDFPACFKKLESLGYNGPFMMEMWANEGETDTDSVKAAKEWMLTQYNTAVSL